MEDTYAATSTYETMRYSAGAAAKSRPRESVSCAMTKVITAQIAIPTIIGNGVPSKKIPATIMQIAPVANFNVPISADAVPANSP